MDKLINGELSSEAPIIKECKIVNDKDNISNPPLSSMGVESLLRAAKIVSTPPKILTHSKINHPDPNIENSKDLEIDRKIPSTSSMIINSLSDLDDDIDVLCSNPKSNISSKTEIIKCAGKCNRKMKSLSVLCNKFLSIYLSKPDETQIKVDELSSDLGVERRRIYDIMNIFMAIFIITKKAKNCYLWHGMSNLKKYISKIKNIQFNTEPLQLSRCYSLDSAQTSFNSSLKLSRTASIDGYKKEKSLELLTQQFLALLINRKIMGMDEVAKLLIDVSDEPSRNFNTKIRRLYDIANVLSTLRMIERVKIETTNTRKLAFRYLGVDNIQNLATEIQVKEDPETLMSQASPCSLSTDSGILVNIINVSTNSQSKNSFIKDLEILIEKYPSEWEKLLDSAFILKVSSNIYPQSDIIDQKNDQQDCEL